MHNKTFKCSKLLIFKKNQVNIVKKVELFKIVDYLTYVENCVFQQKMTKFRKVCGFNFLSKIYF